MGYVGRMKIDSWIDKFYKSLGRKHPSRVVEDYVPTPSVLKRLQRIFPEKNGTPSDQHADRICNVSCNTATVQPIPEDVTCDSFKPVNVETTGGQFNECVTSSEKVIPYDVGTGTFNDITNVTNTSGVDDQVPDHQDLYD